MEVEIPLVSAQEERRVLYLLHMKKCKVVRKAAIALLALACNWFLDIGNEWFHDDPYHIYDPTISCALDETKLKKA